MNEENSTVVEMEAPRKKKRSLWWLKLLLVLCVFAGGTIFGLKLPTMDLPAQLREMLFPTMQTEAVLPEVSPAEAVTETSVPVPKESAKPTAAPKESAKPMIAPKESTAPSSAPAAEAKPEVSPTAESAAPADKKTESAPGGNEYIGIDAALEAALDHAGVKESDAEVFGVYKSKEDDMAVYSVEFAAESKEYIYSVNALTGTIEGWKTMHVDPAVGLTEAFSAPSPYSYPEQSSSASSNLNDVIEQGAAKKAAFEHANVKEADVSGLKVELELDGRLLVYDIEFHSGIYEYEYRIDAFNGNVLGFDKEIG